MITESSRKLLVKDFRKSRHELSPGKTESKRYTRTLEKDQRIDHNSSKSWTRKPKLTSHFERYISDLQEQEIPTKF